MAMTTMSLPAKSIEWLQDLIQVNIDSRDGFKDAADHLVKEDPELESLFRHMSQERSHQASELQRLVAENSQEPTHSGSIAAAAHRTWMDLRTALGGGAHAVLSEAESGEDHIKAKYEEALQDLGSCSCTSVLRQQYSRVISAHNKVKMLRDSYGNK